jgi:hypothetical protein
MDVFHPMMELSVNYYYLLNIAMNQDVVHYDEKQLIIPMGDNDWYKSELN